MTKQSAELSRALAKRIALKAERLGSMLYNLKWKDRLTPAGTAVPSLRATPLRQAKAGESGWLTPMASDRGSGKAMRMLSDQAKLAGDAEVPMDPSHPRWLMGLPSEWDDCAAAAEAAMREARDRGRKGKGGSK